MQGRGLTSPEVCEMPTLHVEAQPIWSGGARGLDG
jgi:hypothetical protein